MFVALCTSSLSKNRSDRYDTLYQTVDEFLRSKPIDEIRLYMHEHVDDLVTDEEIRENYIKYTDDIVDIVKREVIDYANSTLEFPVYLFIDNVINVFVDEIEVNSPDSLEPCAAVRKSVKRMMIPPSDKEDANMIKDLIDRYVDTYMEEDPDNSISDIGEIIFVLIDIIDKADSSLCVIQSNSKDKSIDYLRYH